MELGRRQVSALGEGERGLAARGRYVDASASTFHLRPAYGRLAARDRLRRSFAHTSQSCRTYNRAHNRFSVLPSATTEHSVRRRRHVSPVAQTPIRRHVPTPTLFPSRPAIPEARRSEKRSGSGRNQNPREGFMILLGSITPPAKEINKSGQQKTGSILRPTALNGRSGISQRCKAGSNLAITQVVTKKFITRNGPRCHLSRIQSCLPGSICIAMVYQRRPKKIRARTRRTASERLDNWRTAVCLDAFSENQAAHPEQLP